MALYRNISLNFWQDLKIVDDFDKDDKYFYLYLLTNPHTNLIGCYQISFKQISDETGFSKDEVVNLINRMVNVHKVIMFDNETKEILINNWYKYNWTTSPKLVKPLEKDLSEVKSSKFIEILNEMIKKRTDTIPYQYGIDTTDTVSVTDTVLNTDYLKELFKEYLDFRKTMKLSNSKTVQKDLLDFLSKYNDKDKEKIIKKAIKNGWKEFYPVNERKEVKEEKIVYETI